LNRLLAPVLVASISFLFGCNRTENAEHTDQLTCAGVAEAKADSAVARTIDLQQVHTNLPEDLDTRFFHSDYLGEKEHVKLVYGTKSIRVPCTGIFTLSNSGVVTVSFTAPEMTFDRAVEGATRLCEFIGIDEKHLQEWRGSKSPEELLQSEFSQETRINDKVYAVKMKNNLQYSAPWTVTFEVAFEKKP
jgi:hypothetical protein